ncbi:unknown [Roseburia sp. CAG:182]|nr:unknown [Roseburia sp. CAG:182]
MEKPNSAKAVIATLSAVTFPAPSFLVRRSLCRLETIVPRAMIMEMIPA